MNGERLLQDMESSVPPGERTFAVNVGNLPPGVYIYTLRLGNQAVSGRLIKLD
jgi:hypothetical protein